MKINQIHSINQTIKNKEALLAVCAIKLYLYQINIPDSKTAVQVDNERLLQKYPSTQCLHVKFQRDVQHTWEPIQSLQCCRLYIFDIMAVTGEVCVN